MGLVEARWLTEEDRKRFGSLLQHDRRQKPVSLAPPPPTRKATAKETAEQVAFRVLGSMLADRDKFAVLVQTMRNVHGARVEWMTDEQVAEFAREVYEREARAAAERVFRRQGRGRELVVNLDGF